VSAVGMFGHDLGLRSGCRSGPFTVLERSLLLRPEPSKQGVASATKAVGGRLGLAA
jgi:hypothetical protein